MFPYYMEVKGKPSLPVDDVKAGSLSVTLVELPAFSIGYQIVSSQSNHPNVQCHAYHGILQLRGLNNGLDVGTLIESMFDCKQ